MGWSVHCNLAERLFDHRFDWNSGPASIEAAIGLEMVGAWSIWFALQISLENLSNSSSSVSTLSSSALTWSISSEPAMISWVAMGFIACYLRGRKTCWNVAESDPTGDDWRRGFSEVSGPEARRGSFSIDILYIYIKCSVPSFFPHAT